MSERGFTVRLSARVDQYVAAMNAAKASTSGLSTDAGRNLQQLGGKMQSVGRMATTTVTLPIVGAGVAAVKMGSDFNEAFSRMVGLAGVPASEVAELKESVKQLAGETARSPQELAEALYFLRSSGLDSADAMAALDMSAKASAAGLGNTATIADAVSSAMNAYAASGLTAAEATDILTGAAAAGKAEPDQLAGALGRVLPISSELGVSFADTGGALAALSLTGNDASTSATLLTNILAKLLKPSQQGAEALAAVGMSTDTIRASIAENGLLDTLNMLRDKLGDAGFTKFMEDAQAVQGALSLTGDNAVNVAAAFDTVNNAAGATDSAFAAIDPQVQAMKQAWVDLQVALIEAGQILIPIVADLAGGIGDLAQWFSDLPPAAQEMVMILGAIAAVGGPLIFIIGSLIRNLESMVAGFKLLRTAMIGHPLLTIATVLAAVGAAFVIFGDGGGQAAKRVDDLADKIRDATNAAEGLNNVILEMVTGNDQMRAAMEASGLTTDDLAAAIAGGDTELKAFTAQLKEGANAAGIGDVEFLGLAATVFELAEADRKAAQDAAELAAVTAEGTAATEASTIAVGKASAAENDYIAWLEQRGAQSEATAEQAAAAAERHAAAEEVVRKAIDEARQAIEEQSEAMLEAADIQRDLIDARRSAVDATYALRSAENSFKDSVEEANETLKEHNATTREGRDALDDAAQAAQAVADAQVDLARSTAEAEGATFTATQQVDLMNDSLLNQAAMVDGPVRQALVDHIAQLNGIPPEVASEILALLDEGKVAEANTALDNASRTRNAAIVADALTSDAEAALNHLARNRFARVDVTTGGVLKYAEGTNYHPGGLAIVGERGPELVALPAGSKVFTAAETSGMLTPHAAVPTGTPYAPSTSSSQSVSFGDVHVTEQADVEMVFARANTALALLGGR